MVPEMDLRITEMLDSPAHRDYALGVKRRLRVIVEDCLRIGVINPDELMELAGSA